MGAAELWLRRAERGDLGAICPCLAAVNVIHNMAKLQPLSERLSKLIDTKVPTLPQPEQDKMGACWYSYYRRAASAGNANAQYLLAGMYKGAEAKRLVELAAKNGSPEAQFDVGRDHMLDDDLVSTVNWWKLAAAQRYGLALYALSHMYRDGRGVPQDFEAAAKLLAEDAQQGSFNARIELGEMYEKGQGVPQDFVQAHFWFNVAGATSVDEGSRRRANEARDRIAQHMTREQIADAQRLARDWRPRAWP